MNRLTRIDRILQSHARVKLAADQLHQLAFTDERFADAVNEYRDALDHRSIVEKVKL
jgi:hypothetical protein